MKGQTYAIPVLIIIAAVLALVLTSQTPQSVACTEEAKLCPDGSYVGRTGPNCEFAPCPGEKIYIGNSAEECNRIQFLCVPGTERFDNENGCGCQKTTAA